MGAAPIDPADYLPLVYTQARRFRGRTLEEGDCIGEGWLALLRACRGYRPSVGEFEPYAEWVIFNHLRRTELRQSRRPRLRPGGEAIDDPPPHDPPPVAPLVGRLPPRQAEVIRLRYFEGLTCMQVAARLGIANQVVGTAERRALVRLRRFAQFARLLA